MSNLDILAALQSSDQEIIEVIAPPFLESVGTDRDKLIHTATTLDHKGLEMVAHSLKGVVGHFGMSTLESQLRKIENNARLGKSEPGAIDEVVVIIDALERGVKSFVAGPSAKQHEKKPLLHPQLFH
jgi:HPt (histidine-containing phosphotransfer) domain-containing protein